jgi:hypothetical protein
MHDKKVLYFHIKQLLKKDIKKFLVSHWPELEKPTKQENCDGSVPDIDER